ncbi:MAG: RloB family protein [Lachnospiraceae bacterium]|nr:RloB family protein [Lachnospiraceae bacterium]
MPILTSRTPFTLQHPYRTQRPATSKIIFLSFEGSVTEEEYFNMIKEIFKEVSTKITFISVTEDAVHTRPKYRTSEQELSLSKNRPKQLVEKIDIFKTQKRDIFEFEKYPEDEFWIVTDVDNNLSPDWIDEWNEALDQCAQKGYSYAVSNPFFEIWLLLHHDNANTDDKAWAVTDEHEYEPTNHFRERLRKLRVPLKDKKHISENHYNRQNIQDAIERATALHIQNGERYPKYFATTVYLLLCKIINML